MISLKISVCFIAATLALIHVTECFLTQPEISVCINAQNKLRALHSNTDPLEWDDEVAEMAQQHAEELLATRGTSKSHDGENIFLIDNGRPGTCAIATLSWYNEIENYDFSSAESNNGKPVGSFTQLVWRITTKFGVGIAIGKSLETYIVAKYSPKGNVYSPGKKLQVFAVNVQPRVSGAVTPSLTEIDPSSGQKQACANALGDSTCAGYADKCFGAYQQYLRVNCFKFCGYC